MATQELRTGTDEDIGSDVIAVSGDGIVSGSDDTMVSPAVEGHLAEAAVQQAIHDKPNAAHEDQMAYARRLFLGLLGAIFAGGKK